MSRSPIVQPIRDTMVVVMRASQFGFSVARRHHLILYLRDFRNPVYFTLYNSYLHPVSYPGVPLAAIHAFAF